MIAFKVPFWRQTKVLLTGRYHGAEIGLSSGGDNQNVMLICRIGSYLLSLPCFDVLNLFMEGSLEGQ